MSKRSVRKNRHLNLEELTLTFKGKVAAGQLIKANTPEPEVAPAQPVYAQHVHDENCDHGDPR